ncbi:MAG: acyl carrier protein [Geobacter sp.]|jgi:acyl carrier protein|nr:acyl carrier protein [Geobacter sp.]
MNREQISAEFGEILSSLLPGCGPVFGADQHLQRDLGLDSTQFVQLVVACEQRFDLQVSDAEILRLRTVGDCIAYLCRQRGV